MTDTETKWSRRVEAWRASGKSLPEFAEGQPYKAATLRWWSTELKRRAEGAARGGRKGLSRGRRAASAPPIAMARVVRRTSKRAAGGLLVEVNGARISVEDGFDTDLFGAVVRALRGAT